MQYFGAHDGPVPLTEYVWFVLTYHFCLRGSESQAQLRVEDLQEWTSDSGEAYYTLATAYKTKTDQGGLTSSNSVSDGLVQDPLQVAAVKKLLSKIDCKQTTRLFQMAKKHWEKDRDGLWFTGQPLGKNTIVHFMRDISKKANLSKVYTNHCVRATCISRLAEGGVSNHVIMATSGHRSVQSLASYHRPSEEMKKMKASLLDEFASLSLRRPLDLLYKYNRCRNLPSKYLPAQLFALFLHQPNLKMRVHSRSTQSWKTQRRRTWLSSNHRPNHSLLSST